MTLEHLETLIAFAVVMLGVSLLITVFTQMVSGLFGLRGTNLLWGLKTLFATVDQRLVDQAEVVLRRPLISDSAFSKYKDVPVIGKLIGRWTLSTALRPDELARELRYISAELKTSDPATALVIDNALTELDPETERKVKLITGAITVVAPASAAQVAKIAQQIAEKTEQTVGKLETLFNSAMGRVSARFGLQMRLWTVLFAGLLAFGLHLNAFSLLDRLWSNPQMRESLVSSRDAMMKEAGTIVALPSASEQGTAVRVAPQAYSDAVKALQGKDPDATKALGDIPPAFESLDAAEKWLEPKLNADENRKKILLVEYRKLVSVELMDQANRIRGLLEGSAFELIPKPYPGLFHYGGKRDVLGILFSPDVSHGKRIGAPSGTKQRSDGTLGKIVAGRTRRDLDCRRKEARRGSFWSAAR